MLEQHLPLIAYQRKEELDREQLGYLAEDAPNDARNMIKTEGYFNSEVSVTPEGEGYRVKVITGKRTTIDNVNCPWARPFAKKIGAAAKPPCSPP